MVGGTCMSSVPSVQGPSTRCRTHQTPALSCAELGAEFLLAALGTCRKMTSKPILTRSVSSEKQIVTPPPPTANFSNKIPTLTSLLSLSCMPDKHADQRIPLFPAAKHVRRRCNVRVRWCPAAGVSGFYGQKIGVGIPILAPSAHLAGGVEWVERGTFCNSGVEKPWGRMG